MADTTFSPGTTIASSWLNDVNSNIYDSDSSDAPIGTFRNSLANADTGKGDALVAVKKSSATSVVTTQHEVNERVLSVFDYLSEAQKADVIAGTFTLDCRAAVQAAITDAISGGIKKIKAPGKGYLINGVAGADTMLNGIVFPFGVVNYAPRDQLIFEGDGGGTVFRCGTAGMIMFRVARNCTILRDLTIEGAGLANTWGVGLVPESMTQTTQQVSNSFCELHNVSRVNLTEGLVFQPGPRVGGSDSGCFYFNVYGGASDTNVRHIWLKKGATWAVDQNRVTRTNFYGQRLVRGNTGYQFDAGTEINIFGGNEEFIAQGVTPNATPTARVIDAACVNINYYGGYAEACTRSTTTPPRDAATGIAKVHGFGYSFNSAADIAEWNNNADSMADNLGIFTTLNLLLVSSGGGTQGAGTITGYARKMPGGLVFLTIVGSVAPGTLAAGNLSLSGMPLVPTPAGQRVPVMMIGGVTLAGANTVSGLLSGGNLLFRKSGITGAGDGPLTRGEITGATFDFSIQGVYAY